MDHLPTRSQPEALPAHAGRAPAPRGGAPAEPALHLGEVASALRRGAWLILGVTVAVGTAVAGGTWLLPKEYEATSMVFVDTERAGNADAAVAAAATGGGDVPVERRGIATEIGRLEHSEVLRRRVADRLLEAGAVVGHADRFPLLAPAVDGDSLPSRADVARRVGESLAFQVEQGQDMISIRAVSPAPEEAARLANVYAEEYEKLARESSRARVVAARTFLEQQVDRLGGDLDAIDGSVASFSQRRRVAERGAAGERVVAEQEAYRSQRDRAAMERTRQQFALDVIEGELARLDPAGASVRTSRIASLETEVAAYDRQMADLRLRAEPYYAVDPSLRGEESRVPELAEIQQSLGHYAERRAGLVAQLAEASAEVQRGDAGGYAASLQAQRLELGAAIRGLDAEIGALDRRIGGTSSQIASAPRAAVRLEQLQRRRAIVGGWHEAYLRDLQKVMVAEQSELGYVELVSPAYVPGHPARPNLTQNAVLGALLGLGLGIGFALARHSAQPDVRRPEDLAAQGYRVLGVVPTMTRQIRASYGRHATVDVEGRPVSTHLLTMLEPWSPAAEHFRLIRTNLLHDIGPTLPATGDGMAVGAPARASVVLVTSPNSGAGKTVSAGNLAVAFAAGGYRTLLIDADLRRPAVHALFGLDGGHGVSDLLGAAARAPGPGEPDEPDAGRGVAPLQTAVDHLFVLPAGLSGAPPSELLGGPAAERLIARARQAFDVVVVDSPPVLVAADAVLLASHVDAVLLVVAADRTTRHAVEQSRRAMASVGRDIAGVIVNRFDTSGAEGYAYGYGTATYGRSAPPEGAP